jgi:hypothetical protein
MSSKGLFWAYLHQLIETVNANGERTENLKGAIYDFSGMKPVDQTRLRLELNVATLALQEMSLLVAMSCF